MNEAAIIQLLSKALDVVKMLAPAFVMAWMDRLRVRTKEAEAQAQRASLEAEVAREETQLAKETANLPRRARMLRLLQRGARRRDEAGPHDGSG